MCEKCDIHLQVIFKDNVACILCIVGPSCWHLPGEKTYDVVLILRRMFDSPRIRCCSLIAFLSEWNIIFSENLHIEYVGFIFFSPTSTQFVQPF